jgi:hypothetical protein
MRAIAGHNMVAACWSSHGVMRFKLKDSEQVRTVQNVLDTVENIIKP